MPTDLAGWSGSPLAAPNSGLCGPDECGVAGNDAGDDDAATRMPVFSLTGFS
jgi:hypothetical protein